MWETEKPRKWSFRGAAGLGFEPRLTDPESGPARSQQLLDVNKAAYLSCFLLRSVSRCSAVFLAGWCIIWCRKTQR